MSFKDSDSSRKILEDVRRSQQEREKTYRERALKMYAEGADYVFIPRILAAQNLTEMVDLLQKNKLKKLSSIIKNEIDMLQTRNEIIR